MQSDGRPLSLPGDSHGALPLRDAVAAARPTCRLCGSMSCMVYGGMPASSPPHYPRGLSPSLSPQAPVVVLVRLWVRFVHEQGLRGWSLVEMPRSHTDKIDELDWQE
eukprot:scaffold22088_cov114-Isochrysis_galbana.AAC.1